MSRLDRQIDKVSGEQVIKVRWPSTITQAEVERLRRRLIREIDRRRHRVPVDLREVQGAPPQLVQMLFELERYAREQDKIFSASWILPELRDAMAAYTGRPIGQSAKPSADPESEKASDLAEQLLDSQQKKPGYDLSKAKRVQRTRKPMSSKTKHRLQLVAMILAGVLIVGSIEAYIIFKDGTSPVQVDRKEFERSP